MTRADADQPIIVVDSATGRWLPGLPTPRLIEAGRGHAWQMTEGIWRLAEAEDDEEAAYRAVRVLDASYLCSADGCERTSPTWPEVPYVCPTHVTLGVDKSTDQQVRSPHQAGTGPAETNGPGAASPEGRNPIMATKKAPAARKMTRREAIASGQRKVERGLGDILAGNATPEAVIADVQPELAVLAATVPETMEALDPAPTGQDVAPATTPAIPDGAVVITMEERDRINATTAKADEPLRAAVAAGTYIRPNGKLPSGPVKETGTDSRYYPRWRMAIVVPAKSAARVTAVTPDASWGWSNPDRVLGQPERARRVTVTESAAKAPRLPSLETVEKRARAKAAAEKVADVDGLAGGEYLTAVGARETQDALEVAAAAALGHDADADAD